MYTFSYYIKTILLAPFFSVNSRPLVVHILRLKPLGNSLFSIIMSSLFKTPVPLQKISADIASYDSVFNKVKEIAGPACLSCEAFPIDLIIPDELRGNDEVVMNVRLSSETFSGAIVEKYNQYIQKM